MPSRGFAYSDQLLRWVRRNAQCEAQIKHALITQKCALCVKASAFPCRRSSIADGSPAPGSARSKMSARRSSLGGGALQPADGVESPRESSFAAAARQLQAEEESVSTSAELFPRSFQIQRTGSTDSLASIVSPFRLYACTIHHFHCTHRTSCCDAASPAFHVLMFKTVISAAPVLGSPITNVLKMAAASHPRYIATEEAASELTTNTVS